MATNGNVPATIPALGGEQSLNRYLSEIKKFPILSARAGIYARQALSGTWRHRGGAASS